MTKAQIIEKVLKDFWDHSEENGFSRGDDACYEKTIVEAVEKSLQQVDPNADIRTCEDFGNLDVKCCENCHGLYQHFEIALIEIESGGSAWICCALGRALNPMKHAGDPKLPENCSLSEALSLLIRENENAREAQGKQRTDGRNLLAVQQPTDLRHDPVK